MQAIRRAVIDVGTNSVKLLVADVAGREVQPVCEQSHQTRLGQGFYETHRLRAEAIAATAEAVADFAADGTRGAGGLGACHCHQRGAGGGESRGVDGGHREGFRPEG